MNDFAGNNSHSFTVNDDWAGIDEPAEFDPNAKVYASIYPIHDFARDMLPMATEAAWRDVGKLAGEALRLHAATGSTERLVMHASVKPRRRSPNQSPYGCSQEVNGRLYVSKTETRHFTAIPQTIIRSTLDIEPTRRILRELRDRAARPIKRIREQLRRRPEWWTSTLRDIAVYNRVWEST